MAGDDEDKAAAAKTTDDDQYDDENEDLEALQQEIARMEAEAARITKETEQLQKKKDAVAGEGKAGGSGTANTTNGAATNGEGTAAKDNLSIYVGQVDYSTTPEELLAHFQPCGTVERVTIVCDKMTGKPKGKKELILSCPLLLHLFGDLGTDDHILLIRFVFLFLFPQGLLILNFRYAFWVHL